LLSIFGDILLVGYAVVILKLYLITMGRETGGYTPEDTSKEAQVPVPEQDESDDAPKNLLEFFRSTEEMEVNGPPAAPLTEEEQAAMDATIFVPEKQTAAEAAAIQAEIDAYNDGHRLSTIEEDEAQDEAQDEARVTKGDRILAYVNSQERARAEEKKAENEAWAKAAAERKEGKMIRDIKKTIDELNEQPKE